MLSDECTESKELSIYSVKDRLQKVSLPRVLAVEELEKLQDEPVINHLLPDARLKVGGLQETQEKLVDKLEENGVAATETLLKDTRLSPLTVRCGQEASRVGSSSSGSKSGFSLGGKVRNKLQAI